MFNFNKDKYEKYVYFLCGIAQAQSEQLESIGNDQCLEAGCQLYLGLYFNSDHLMH